MAEINEYALEDMEDRISTCWLDTRITTPIGAA